MPDKAPTSKELMEALTYEIMLMGKMLDQLPTELQTSLRDQLTKIVSSISVYMHVHNSEIIDGLDDTSVLVHAMKHDLEATKRERNDAIKKLSDE
jgi:hypothetical protein